MHMPGLQVLMELNTHTHKHTDMNGNTDYKVFDCSRHVSIQTSNSSVSKQLRSA